MASYNEVGLGVCSLFPLIWLCCSNGGDFFTPPKKLFLAKITIWFEDILVQEKKISDKKIHFGLNSGTVFRYSGF